MRLMKLTVLALLGSCLACAPALSWFDSGTTAPHDVRWFATGATLDASLQLAKVPVGWRFAADATAASVVRLTPWFGKNLDSGLLLSAGAMFSEIIGLFIRKHP